MTVNYLKWFAMVVLVAGMFINAFGVYPLGPIVLTIGSALWTVVAVMWKETSLIINNAILTIAGPIGLLYTYLG